MISAGVLDELLSKSAAFSEAIEAGHIGNLDSAINEYTRCLLHYLEGRTIRDLPRYQQRLLHQLLENQNRAIQSINRQKQLLAGQISELRNGRILSNTYRKI